jgi:hypothetical protein
VSSPTFDVALLAVVALATCQSRTDRQPRSNRGANLIKPFSGQIAVTVDRSSPPMNDTLVAELHAAVDDKAVA